ncbi:uncharacterized protein ASCRUDRAFT_75127 [Ascoidea rubescens DSM 1968]|uniref:FAR-17a/AIG1-like protein n=1 Tax=Ascoidea rubescens DSM 1968 TaxID=1344418 RepID=A0A1D2VJU4_9ASCO|nr:hypothetical protein ASCRUDRAFT_75127 [Ascoidea rubescens DSM 1968]ODV61858.1 hypothetical protein ASCRUDRAFT_75127 [Ascoidea rubescens DSM 1968]
MASTSKEPIDSSTTRVVPQNHSSSVSHKNIKSLLLNVSCLLISSYGLIFITKLQLPSNLSNAGHKQFLTNISCVLTIINYLFAIVSQLLNSPSLYSFKNNYVHSIALILESIVFIIYWPLKLFFIHLIAYKRDVDLTDLGEIDIETTIPDGGLSSLPFSIDFSIHFVPYVSLLIDYMFFLPNFTISNSKVFFITFSLSVSYWFWLDYLIDPSNGDSYPYPFLNFSTSSRLIIFFIVSVVALGSFLLHKKIHSLIVEKRSLSKSL